MEAPSVRGLCYALFVFDVGASIDLDEAERRLRAPAHRGHIRRKRRTPQYFEYRPAPIRVIQDAEPLKLGEFLTTTSLELVLYDFGALSVTYGIPFHTQVSLLLSLSELLYENPLLLAESRRHVEEFLRAIEAAVERPRISDFLEDYLIFELSPEPVIPLEEFRARYARDIAQILRSESAPLSEQELREALSCQLSFSIADVAIIDWNGALLVGEDMEDVRAVLEFANVELLEMRYLDQQLDDALDQAYETLSRGRARRFRLPGSFQGDLERVAQLQVDSAILFERVTNTLKLIGDQYLARVHRFASQRLHLESWDASILRKLQTLNSIYSKMADRAATSRLEVLEWIIIVLIALSIVISLLPGL
ncbi:hypothetical protein [Candidatus Nitrospira bockiana]